MPVNLYGKDFPCSLGKFLRQRPDAGADFNHRLIGMQIRRCRDLGENMRVNQKVLSEFLLKPDLILLYDPLGVRQYSVRCERALVHSARSSQ